MSDDSLFFRTVCEAYPCNQIKEFKRLGVNSRIESSDSFDDGWGSALSLSLEETLQYVDAKGASCFIPSTGLMFKFAKQLLQKESLSRNEECMLRELNTYWHRTSSAIVFPVEARKGSIIHYMSLGTDSIGRQNGQVTGEIVLEVDNHELPPYNSVSRIEDYPAFFEKLLCLDYLEGYDQQIKEKLGMELSLWIPAEECIRKSPVKLIIFGAFVQYGMGVWLTSYTDDKTLVGPRPFRLAYDLLEPR